MLARVLADHAAGKVRQLQLLSAVRQLRNRRHESTLGWREINDAVRQAEEDLRAPQGQERGAAPRPPAQPGPAPARKRNGIWAATDDRAEAAMPAALAAAGALGAAPVADRVRAAYQALAAGTPAAYVRIADLRRALPGVPRSQLDHALGRMYRDHRANLVSQADQESLTGEDRQSSLHIGGMDKHRISIEPDSGY
jgi:hypothetical protein